MLGQCTSSKRYNVIILAGGNGLRMGDMTNYIPKALSPLGNLRGIDHIINRYSLIAHKFIIGLGTNGDLLKNYLLGKYPSNTFEFSEEKEVKNNAWSTLYAMDHVDIGHPTIIAFCDQLIIGNPEVEGNIVYYVDDSTKGNVGTFRHSIRDGRIVKNEGPIEISKGLNGVIGTFVCDDSLSLKRYVYNEYVINDLTDDIIKPYLENNKYQAVLVDALLDFGTEQDLEECRKLWESV